LARPSPGPNARRRPSTSWKVSFLVALTTSAVLFIGPAGAATKTDVKDAQARLEAIVRRMADATRQQNAVRADLSAVLAQLDSNRTTAERVGLQIRAAQDSIEGLLARVAATQVELDHRVALAFMEPPLGALDALLGSDSLSALEDGLVFLSVANRKDKDLISALANQRVLLGAEQERLHGLKARLGAAGDRLSATAEEVNAKLAGQEAILKQLAADRAQAEALVQRLTDQNEGQLALPALPSPTLAPTPSPTGSGSFTVPDLIVKDFTPLGSSQGDIALCVAKLESNYDPSAVNPTSGAAGVFQFLPSTWDTMSAAAGWGGSSVFGAEANVAVAAWTVSNYGWSPWRSTASLCGWSG
jgi:peptidoglycan hydrolase CwlO-like protein